MTVIGALQLHDGVYLCQLVLAACALALETLKSMDDPFRESVQTVKNHPGQIEAAAFCRNLIEGSRYVRNLDEIRGSIAESYEPTTQTISHADASIQTTNALRGSPQELGLIVE